jgi:hypothetical protein
MANELRCHSGPYFGLMGAVSDLVEELLNATGWQLPRLRSIIVASLAAIAIAFPAAFATGVISWSNERACSLDLEYVPLITIPNIPRMNVVEKNGLCTVVPVTTSTGASIARSKS